MSLRKSIVAVLAALMLLASCSDGDDSSDGSAPQESVDDTDGAAPGDSESDAADPAPNTLTPQGFGAVMIGMSEQDASDAGAIEGEWAPNCEISGGTETFALLAPPVIGQAYALDGSVSAILVLDESVATEPGGVTVGSTRDDALSSFTAAGLTMEVDESTAEAYGVFFWTASDADADIFGGSIDPDTGLVTAIATPYIPVCK